MRTLLCSLPLRILNYQRPVLFVLVSLSLLRSRPVESFCTNIAALKYTGNPPSRQYESFSTLSMAKRDSPSAQRNKDVIWEVLSSKVFPACSEPVQILAIACGSGVHEHYFSLKLAESGKSFAWYPSDPDEEARASVQAYVDDEPSLKDKLQPPIDVTLAEHGPVDESVLEGKIFNVMTCINMIHISPWEATLGVMKLAGKHLASGGILYLYGPYKVKGTSAESNLYVYV